MEIHQRHCQRQMGVLREHIFKKKSFHDVILSELLSEDWLAQKRYQRYIAIFE